MSESKYQIHEKWWVVSEFKQSLIEVMNNFVKKRNNYVNAVHGIMDPYVSKAEYMSALYELFNMLSNGYEFPKGLTEDDYKALAYTVCKHNPEKLVDMGYYLHKWAISKGPFRITHQEKVFNDIVDQMEYENQMT